MKNLITITLGLFLGMTSVSTAQIIKNKEVVKVKKTNKVQQDKPLDLDHVMVLKKRINLISPLKTDRNVAIDATLNWEIKLLADDGISNQKPPSPRYDVYFGTETTPTKVSSGQIERSFKPMLEHNTTYYWKVVITGSTDEIDKSLVYSFKTAPFINWDDNKFGTFIDPRDNKSYKVIKIGEQVWFAENLAYLPKITPYYPEMAGKVFYDDYYVYEYRGFNIEEAKSTFNYKTFGVLYSWTAAMDRRSTNSENNPSGVQGACPCGWHVPSISEWQHLIAAVSNNGEIPHDMIGKALASNTIWETKGGKPDNVAYRITNNSTGFNALPSGWGEIHSNNDGAYLVHKEIGNRTRFWTTSKAFYDVNKQWSSFQISKWRGDINISERFNSDALSVRCVKN